MVTYVQTAGGSPYGTKYFQDIELSKVNLKNGVLRRRLNTKRYPKKGVKFPLIPDAVTVTPTSVSRGAGVTQVVTIAGVRLERGSKVTLSNNNEVQTIGLGAASAGSVTITFAGQTTGAIAFNAAAATVQTALEALSNVAPGDIVVTGGPFPGVLTLTFGGVYANLGVAEITATPTGLTGGAVTIATTVQGANVGITSSVSGQKELALTATFVIAATAPTGARDIVVTTLDGGVDTLTAAFTINA